MEVMEYMVGNPEFEDKWHTRAFEEYTGPNERRWSDMMSGHWSWKQSVSTYFNDTVPGI